MPRPATCRPTAQKKTLGARERDVVERLLFADVVQTLDASRVKVVDESSTHIGMTPAYARSAPGTRAYDSTPRNYGHNLTLIASLSVTGMDAPMTIKGAVNSSVFEAYIREVLCPTLRPGDIVLMDNLVCHKTAVVAALIASRQATILWLPRYSPDLSPIEKAFSKLKTWLRYLKAQTIDALIDAIAQGLTHILPDDALGWFTSCGFLNLAHAT